MNLSQFIYFLVLPSLAAMPIALVLRGLRPLWSIRRAVLIAAAPLSSIAALLGLYLTILVIGSSAKECGVDACGMALAGAMLLMVLAAIIYGAGSLLAWILLRLMRTR